jgi:hypothetical protein
MTSETIQGKNEYVYIMIERKLEKIGTGDATNKSFTVSKTPIADADLSGTVDANDVEVYVGGALRTNLVAATVSTVTEKTGAIALSSAPALAAIVYATYKYVYGHVVYAQDYSASGTLDTKAIQPLSSDVEETMETVWKFEGSMKLWEADPLEEALMCGVDQSTDTVQLDDEYSIPVPVHNLVFKKVRSTATTYKVLSGVKITSLEETGKGGDLTEVSYKFTATGRKTRYTVTTDSGM